ncbi:cupin domain-containing protein [Haloplasma contractile]|uniref:Methionyl-tRNA synthetase protein n=1 Tax=Haloplasma contractile SSD-17B TaxID=1033810 RepID=U2E925_9MOLU|nr:cupin domain-containing protein [Haloplasma contractile]ERJ11643.1 methionyl-tRNA synthetase protein [Haloplasma contractile SSD-17B]
MIKNFLNSKKEEIKNCHDGEGTLKHITVFEDDELKSNLRFINYTILPPGTSIGTHQHGNDEEVYVILEGNGEMTLSSKIHKVKSGDVVLNKPYGIHSLTNTSRTEMRILVFEVAID